MSKKMSKKIKVGFLNSISEEWFYLYSDRLEQVNHVDNADYIIYESNGDPIPVIMKIKNTFPKNKLVFILSGDQSAPIDNNCIWFTNAVPLNGLARLQTQIFVTNPAIFKFYDMNSELILGNCSKINNFTDKCFDIYFKGTIWTGMRTNMFEYFINKPRCKIIENNKYWGWRLNNGNTPTQQELEEVAHESYKDMLDSKLVLCPKGNGNSSMRIIEALGCGAIPILINDFSKPFGFSWSEVGLCFDTNVDNWETIYSKCCELLNDKIRFMKLRDKGMLYFKNVIYGDSKNEKLKMYKNVNSVCFGFSNLIVDKIENLYNAS